MTNVGEVQVAIKPDARDFGRDLAAQVNPQLHQATQQWNQLLKRGLAAAGIFGAANEIKKSVNLASDLNENLNVTKLTFDEASAAALKFGQTGAAAIGMTASEALRSSAQLGGMIKNMGLGATEAQVFSERLVKLAADMGSAFNAQTSEVIFALGAGLRGETEPLRRFNIFLSQAAIAEQALATGLIKTKSELDNKSRALAAMNLIFQQSNDVAGDFQNTLGESLPNQLKVMRAELDSARIALGDELLPYVLELVTIFREEATPAIRTFAEAVGPALGQGLSLALPLLEAAGPVLQAMADALNAIPTPVLTALGSAWFLNKNASMIHSMFPGGGAGFHPLGALGFAPPTAAGRAAMPMNPAAAAAVAPLTASPAAAYGWQAMAMGGMGMLPAGVNLPPAAPPPPSMWSQAAPYAARALPVAALTGGMLLSGSQNPWMSGAGTALSMAGAGAAIGSMIPGVGTLVGGGLGLVGGAGIAAFNALNAPDEDAIRTRQEYINGLKAEVDALNSSSFARERVTAEIMAESDLLGSREVEPVAQAAGLTTEQIVELASSGLTGDALARQASLLAGRSFSADGRKWAGPGFDESNAQIDIYQDVVGLINTIRDTWDEGGVEWQAPPLPFGIDLGGRTGSGMIRGTPTADPLLDLYEGLAANGDAGKEQGRTYFNQFLEGWEEGATPDDEMLARVVDIVTGDPSLYSRAASTLGDSFINAYTGQIKSREAEVNQELVNLMNAAVAAANDALGQRNLQEAGVQAVADLYAGIDAAAELKQRDPEEWQRTFGAVNFTDLVPTDTEAQVTGYIDTVEENLITQWQGMITRAQADGNISLEEVVDINAFKDSIGPAMDDAITKFEEMGVPVGELRDRLIELEDIDPSAKLEFLIEGSVDPVFRQQIEGFVGDMKTVDDVLIALRGAAPTLTVMANSGMLGAGWFSSLDEFMGFINALPAMAYPNGYTYDARDGSRTPKPASGVGATGQLRTWNPNNNAYGGVVRSPMLSWLGEQSLPEVVIPLTNPTRAAQLVEESGLVDVLAGAPGGRDMAAVLDSHLARTSGRQVSIGTLVVMPADADEFLTGLDAMTSW